MQFKTWMEVEKYVKSYDDTDFTFYLHASTSKKSEMELCKLRDNSGVWLREILN